MDDLPQRQAGGIEPQLTVTRHPLVGLRHLEADSGGQLAPLSQRALHLGAHVLGKARPVEVKGIAVDGDAVARLLAEIEGILGGREERHEIALGGEPAGDVGRLFPGTIALPRRDAVTVDAHLHPILGIQDAPTP